MKLRKLLVAALLLALLLQMPALATEKEGKVSVKLPSFAVTLNGTQIDSKNSEYPLIVYRDITYFPMTYHGAHFLHLKLIVPAKFIYSEAPCQRKVSHAAEIEYWIIFRNVI